MYNYNFRTLELVNGKMELLIEFQDKSIISTFLESDVQAFGRSYALEEIDKVLNGKSEYEELNGNVCGVEIHKDNPCNDGAW